MKSPGIEHIVGVMEHAIDTFVKYDSSGVRGLYNPRVFRQTIQMTRIQLPRQSGHTSAAVEFVKRHPASMLIHNSDTVKRLKKAHESIADNLFTCYEAIDPNYRSPIKTLAGIRGLDAVIVDTVEISKDDIDYIFEKYEPKQVYIMGDARLIKQAYYK